MNWAELERGAVGGLVLAGLAFIVIRVIRAATGR